MPQSPLTRSQNVSGPRSISASRLVEEWRRVFGIDITSELQGVSTIEHYRCDDSGLEFFLPPGVAGSPQLYQGLQRFEWYYSSHGWELILASRARVFVSTAPRSGALELVRSWNGVEPQG